MNIDPVALSLMMSQEMKRRKIKSRLHFLTMQPHTMKYHKGKPAAKPVPIYYRENFDSSKRPHSPLAKSDLGSIIDSMRMSMKKKMVRRAIA